MGAEPPVAASQKARSPLVVSAPNKSRFGERPLWNLAVERSNLIASLPTISAGVFFGAATPYQVLSS
jgi:hypothetical protein